MCSLPLVSARRRMKNHRVAVRVTASPATDARKHLIGWWSGALASLLGLLQVHAADFPVTASSSASSYTINGKSGNPTLTLVRGETYTLSVSTTGPHPFQISPSTGVSP